MNFICIEIQIYLNEIFYKLKRHHESASTSEAPVFSPNYSAVRE